MRILILGGTGFIGPHQVSCALHRGHTVTVFNRGKTAAQPVPEQVEQLVGDREGDLIALRGREWDVVVDNAAMLPAWVRDTAQILRDHVERYIFISTRSVYADHSKPGQDESGGLQQYTGIDPMRETTQSLIDSKNELYGPLKVLAEQEAEKWFPARTLVLRPGLIVGPGDATDRFTYWPVRLYRGGQVLAPGSPEDPVQIIDARDFAEWTIRMAEDRATGVYNVAGPAEKLIMGKMLEAMQEGIGSDAELIWVKTEFLGTHGVSPWSDLPVWLPPAGEYAGFALGSIQRALEKGLTFRPISETARDTLTWFQSRPALRQAELRAGLKPEREAEVLAAWRSRARG